MLLERHGQLGSFSLLDRDEVLDPKCVKHLSTESIRHHTCADALASRVDGRSRSSRSTADNQHVKLRLVVEFVRLARLCSRIDLAKNFLQAHPALTKQLAVQIQGWHPHDLAVLNLLLEHSAIDHHVLEGGVQHCHRIQRLDDIRTVMARQ